MTPTMITAALGIVIGWCAALLWRHLEDMWAADRAARDLRAWNAAEAKARLRKNVQRRVQEYRRTNTGGDAA